MRGVPRPPVEKEVSPSVPWTSQRGLRGCSLGPVRTLAEDTSPEAERVLIELWRQATPARKFALVFDTTRALQEFILAGLRERHPRATPTQLRRLFADAWLGPDLARRAFGEARDDSE